MMSVPPSLPYKLQPKKSRKENAAGHERKRRRKPFLTFPFSLNLPRKIILVGFMALALLMLLIMGLLDEGMGRYQGGITDTGYEAGSSLNPIEDVLIVEQKRKAEPLTGQGFVDHGLKGDETKSPAIGETWFRLKPKRPPHP